MEPRDKKEIDRDFSEAHFSKADIRHRFAGLRAGKSSLALAELSSQIAASFLQSNLLLHASKVALYHPLGNEVDTSAVFSDLISLGKRVFFPRVCGSDLRFFEVSGPENLSPGSFGVAEPPAESAREIAVSDLELMVVPGICFDRFGSRIGYGKGFYDRAMGELSGEKVCAAAYSFQFVDFELPTEPHDRRVGFVATEHGVFRAQTKRTGEKND